MTDYLEPMTRQQWLKIVNRMMIYWPQWEMGQEAISVWYDELKGIPGLFIWRAVKDHKSDDWPPNLGKIQREALRYYAPFQHFRTET